MLPCLGQVRHWSTVWPSILPIINYLENLFCIQLIFVKHVEYMKYGVNIKRSGTRLYIYERSNSMLHDT
jgi:hypothetical protein